MKLSTTYILALASTFTGVYSAPSAPSTAVQQPESRGLFSLASAKHASLGAADALTIVRSLNEKIHKHAADINHTTSTIKKGSSEHDRKAAIKAVGAQMSAMTEAVNHAVGQIGLKANKASYVKTNGGKGEAEDISNRADPVQGLADALKTTLITAAGTVNTALAVLGLTGLLGFLTPLTGSLSGLVLTLVAVVDSLLPILNTILDGVVIGLSGLLAGLIL